MAYTWPGVPCTPPFPDLNGVSETGDYVQQDSPCSGCDCSDSDSYDNVPECCRKLPEILHIKPQTQLADIQQPQFPAYITPYKQTDLSPKVQPAEVDCLEQFQGGESQYPRPFKQSEAQFLSQLRSPFSPTAGTFQPFPVPDLSRQMMENMNQQMRSMEENMARMQEHMQAQFSNLNMSGMQPPQLVNNRGKPVSNGPVYHHTQNGTSSGQLPAMPPMIQPFQDLSQGGTIPRAYQSSPVPGSPSPSASSSGSIYVKGPTARIVPSSPHYSPNSGMIARSGTPSGTLTRSGSVTPSGTLQRPGSITPSSTLSRSGTLSPTGTLTPSGTLNRTVTPAGTLTRHGSVTPAGTLTRHGSVTPAGTLTRHGSVTPAGTLTRHGSVTPAGTLTRHGTLTRQPGFVTPDPIGGCITEGNDGKKQLKLQFDMHDFKPDEIQVKKEKNRLEVHAHHEDKQPDRISCRVFHQQYDLPKDVRLTKVNSKVTPDGLLTVESPVKPRHRVKFASEDERGRLNCQVQDPKFPTY